MALVASYLVFQRGQASFSLKYEHKKKENQVQMKGTGVRCVGSRKKERRTAKNKANLDPHMVPTQGEQLASAQKQWPLLTQQQTHKIRPWRENEVEEGRRKRELFIGDIFQAQLLMLSRNKMAKSSG